ncbi:MarR family winged helix-turn-helix transcriptional regulator [Microbacterium sp. X-17]|uniref:MarR family winged helix-turn-helix transcriptional regulator n=1 Tax=Microbacterium sp. X-17 TaxID=3144404 RepID=UPI0031F54A04
MDDRHALPLGLRLNQVARVVGQQFDRALTEVGGSLPVWLVLLSLAGRRPATQRELAGRIGITEATLSHHLGAMERQGLIARARNGENRRVHDVSVTDAGLARFHELREVAVAFDGRLNAGLPEADQARLAALLDHVVANISERPIPGPLFDTHSSEGRQT